MNLAHFGDSYDIVKQSLINWLKPCGLWAAHPMFTGTVDQQEKEAFEKFVGVKLLSNTSIEFLTHRDIFVKQAESWAEHLFLDPTTGLFIPDRGQNPSRNRATYLMGDELVRIADARPHKLTLVFDQSISLGKSNMRRRRAKEKLAWLRQHGIGGLTYHSHANFILVSADRNMIQKARKTLLENSRLPECRLVELDSEPNK